MNRKYLENALLMERKAFQLFTSLAKSVTNSAQKTLMERFAAQELDHIKEIRKRIALAQVSMTTEQESALTSEINNIFDNEEKIDDIEQAIKKAIEIEISAHKLYSQALKDATDGEDIKFLQFLVKMENEHHETLNNFYEKYFSAKK